jgi:hypothetical protein
VFGYLSSYWVLVSDEERPASDARAIKNSSLPDFPGSPRGEEHPLPWKGRRADSTGGFNPTDHHSCIWSFSQHRLRRSVFTSRGHSKFIGHQRVQILFDAPSESLTAGDDFHAEIVEVFTRHFQLCVFVVVGTPHLRS